MNELFDTRRATPAKVIAVYVVDKDKPLALPAR